MTDDPIPFFTSDQWSADPNARLRTYGEWYQPTRQGRRGPHPALRCRPRPNLLYAQVVKRREKGRVVEVARKIIGGDANEINLCLAASAASTTINTRFVERSH